MKKVWWAVAATTVVLGGCSSVPHGKPAAGPTSPTTLGPLQAPKATPAMDALYFQDLSTVDPALDSYVTSEQDVALRALLTDGSAFCAFLARGGGVDNAMASVVIGANSVESQTHLPASVETYNAVDSVALIALCPKEQSLLPPASRSHIQTLSRTLAGTPSG